MYIKCLLCDQCFTGSFNTWSHLPKVYPTHQDSDCHKCTILKLIVVIKIYWTYKWIEWRMQLLFIDLLLSFFAFDTLDLDGMKGQVKAYFASLSARSWRFWPCALPHGQHAAIHGGACFASTQHPRLAYAIYSPRSSLKHWSRCSVYGFT